MMRRPASSLYHVAAHLADLTNGSYPDLPMRDRSRKLGNGKPWGTLHGYASNSAGMSAGTTPDVFRPILSTANHQGFIGKSLHSCRRLLVNQPSKFQTTGILPEIVRRNG